MESVLSMRWRDATGAGLEHLVLSIGGNAIEARSVVIGPAGHAWVYRVVCDVAWRTRSLSVEAVGGARRLDLSSDGHGTWTRNGANAPDLDGAVDIDLSASPFTNTLPIRRLALDIGRSAEIVTAYVAFPELAVQPDAQRYSRLGARTWLYQAVDGDFEREIIVDASGFVLEYPGLFTRILP